MAQRVGQNLVPGWEPVEHSPVVEGYVSRTLPAPTSFSETVWVIVPSFSVDRPYKCKFGAIHGTTLPAQGAACTVLVPAEGAPVVAWWEGITTAGGVSKEEIESGTVPAGTARWTEEAREMGGTVKELELGSATIIRIHQKNSELLLKGIKPPGAGAPSYRIFEFASTGYTPYTFTVFNESTEAVSKGAIHLGSSENAQIRLGESFALVYDFTGEYWTDVGTAGAITRLQAKHYGPCGSLNAPTNRSYIPGPVGTVHLDPGGAIPGVVSGAITGNGTTTVWSVPHNLGEYMPLDAWAEGTVGFEEPDESVPLKRFLTYAEANITKIEYASANELKVTISPALPNEHVIHFRLAR